MHWINNKHWEKTILCWRNKNSFLSYFDLVELWWNLAALLIICGVFWDKTKTMEQRVNDEVTDIELGFCCEKRSTDFQRAPTNRIGREWGGKETEWWEANSLRKEWGREHDNKAVTKVNASYSKKAQCCC